MKDFRIPHLIWGKRIALISCLIVILAIILITNTFRSNDQTLVYTAASPSAFSAARTYATWAKKIELSGPERAYQIFKESYKNQPLVVQHQEAHIFGGLLYDTGGLDDIATCDDAFLFGCYHGFFGKALTNNGSTVLPALDEACSKKTSWAATGCLHGIGHGILVYLGDQNIQDALAMCDQLATKGRAGGCPSGVFMEYNLGTMSNHKQARIRQVQKENYHEPCNRVDQKYLIDCYVEQPQWWYATNGSFEQNGKLCGEVSDQPAREACYHGIGYVVGHIRRYNLEEALPECINLPSPEAQSLCRTGLSWSFAKNHNPQQEISAICEGILPIYARLCVTNSTEKL